ncbi:retrovirus-related pol polyprotein from transposon TNT 1-94 [Tanacetum coccineum]
MQQPQPNNNFIPQPSFNTNYMQQPMPNPEDITDPTTAMNMTLVLMAKAFKLNYSTPTREFHQTLVIGRLHIRNVGNQTRYNALQNVRNQVVQNAVQNPGVQNVRNKNGIIVVPGIVNQNPNENGNVVAAWAEGQREGCCLSLDSQASTSGTQTDKAPVYDSDGSAEEQYIELLELILELHQVQQNDSNVISEVPSVEQCGRTVEQHHATVEETRAYFESLYNNLAIEIKKVNTVNRKLRETNADLTTELARYKNQECFEISQEKYDKLERCYQKSVYQEQCLTKKINALHLSSGVDNTAKTRRPYPRSNTKNDRVPSASNSSCINNKEVELAIRNDKSEVVYAMCKQCLITANHDVYVRNYVNGMNSRDKKQKENVSKTANKKKHKPKVLKPKKVGSKEKLASPKPRKPRTYLRWSPTGRIFDLKGKIIESNELDSQYDASNGDNACTSNPQEPISKRFPNSTFSLKFLGTVHFGNDHVAAILGYGDLQWGNILITRVYFIEGLGHNLFSVGQFCDSDLEVAFRRNTCFVRNLEGVDLLKGNRKTYLYTINLHEMASAFPICLMAHATSTKSWLWHQRLSHLNFDTIKDLAKNDVTPPKIQQRSGIPHGVLLHNIQR